MKTQRLWARKRLDIGWGDLAFGLAAVCRRRQRRSPALAEIWRGGNPNEDDAILAVLAARGGFDAVLRAARLAPGSAVLMSAVNIPAMAQIVQAHGLIPVSLALDDATLAPADGAFDAAVANALRRGARPAAVVFAHIFGARASAAAMDELAAAAHRRGMLFIEDCAEIYGALDDDAPAASADAPPPAITTQLENPTAPNGGHRQGDRRRIRGGQTRFYRGHPAADVALFSFGPIKTASAGGGGIVVVRRAAAARGLRADAVAAVLDALPPASSAAYALRLLKCGMLKIVTRPLIYRLLARAANAFLSGGFARLIDGAARGFSQTDPAQMLAAVRRAPPPAMLALLARRLGDANQTATTVARRAIAGRFAARRLTRSGIVPPGSAAAAHTYWVFPIRAAAPDALVAALQSNGFDATRGANRLCAIDGDESGMMRDLLYLPADEKMPPAEIARLASIVARMQSPPRPAPTILAAESAGAAATAFADSPHGHRAKPEKISC